MVAVVRLPTYHCDLNPIELIWGIAKHKIASVNVGSIDIKVCKPSLYMLNYFILQCRNDFNDYSFL